MQRGLSSTHDWPTPGAANDGRLSWAHPTTSPAAMAALISAVSCARRGFDPLALTPDPAPATGHPLLTGRGLQVRHGERRALQDVDLDVRQGPM